MSENLPSIIQDAIQSAGIENLNDMQLAMLQESPEQNLLLLAPTGTGKTLSFLLPLLPKLRKDIRDVQVIIVAPARELALQIDAVFKSLKTNIKSNCVYGGHSFAEEISSLSQPPTVLVGTPGRIADHLKRGSFDPYFLHTIVLDEFDKSLQMGYHRDMEVIFKACEGTHQHILTSATPLEEWPGFLPFKNPKQFDFTTLRKDLKIQLRMVKAEPAEKMDHLLRLVSSFGGERCIIFCNHREVVDRISGGFQEYGWAHSVFQGGMEQLDREKNLIKFRNGVHPILVSTDLAARGLDIPDVKHVVHYQVPPKEEEFIHRNGRTGRMFAEGTVYVVASTEERLPGYINPNTKMAEVPALLVVPEPSPWVCLYVSAGKKEKINKGDIVGWMTQKGQLEVQKVGIITTMDHATYVAVDRASVPGLLRKLMGQKIKGLKVKIEEAM